MFKKLSIKWRMTVLSAILLTVCCVGLTGVLNLSAMRTIDTIDASVIKDIATQVPTDTISSEDYKEIEPAAPTQEAQDAKAFFSIQSLIYMLIVIMGGSILTYYVAGKAIKPLNVLNTQVKEMNVNNLSQTLEVPLAEDEIGELTQSFNEMTDKLNNAFLIQKRFSASAAHELRTPLAVLQTKVDVFKKKSTHTSGEYEAIIAVFEKQIHRLRGLVGNLLDMTNLDDEREQSCICIKDMFEEILGDLSVIAKNKNVVITLSGGDSTVFGNVELLYRAFYNLIENAIKYNKDGGTIEIEIIEASDKQTQIFIKDSGIGIPEKMKKHIFEPFYRVDKSRSREMGGAGLGLSIVESIIKKQGGTIGVRDSESGGTCFEIVL